MNKHTNDITVQATVVDADTIRYGGSAFKRERVCHKVPGKMHYGERRPKCSLCGYGLGDDRWAFCPKCGARVESDAE